MPKIYVLTNRLRAQHSELLSWNKRDSEPIEPRLVPESAPSPEQPLALCLAKNGKCQAIFQLLKLQRPIVYESGGAAEPPMI